MADVSDNDRLTAYANWLVQNKDKQGTPEFDKVAAAYKQLRTGAEPDTSMLSGLKQSFADAVAPIGTTATEVGKVTGSDTLQSIGSGVSKVAETMQQPGYEYAEPHVLNPSASDKQIGGIGYEYIPRAIAERAGGLAGSLAARAGGAAVGSVAGPAGTVAGALAGPAILGVVQTIGPSVLERAKNAGHKTPTAEDWEWALGEAGIVGGLSAYGIKDIGVLNTSLLKTFGKQEVSNILQRITHQVATTADTPGGTQVDPRAAVISGTLDTGAGMTADVAARTARAAAPVINPAPAADDPVAAARLASRLKTISDESGRSLKDVDKTNNEGAGSIVDTAHTNLATELNDAYSKLKPELGNDPDVLAAIRNGRNKVKGFVTQSQLDSIEQKVGGTQEGQRLIDLLKESNELSRMAPKAKAVGGISGSLEHLNPKRFTNPFGLLGAIGGANVLAPAFVAAAAPLALKAAALYGGAWGLGRTVDAMTGRRFPLQRYVDHFSTQDTGEAQASQLPSIVDVRKKAQEQRVANDTLQKVSQASGPNLGRENQLANIVPVDGYGLLVYKKTGLKPVEAERGVNILSNEHGLLTRGQVSDFVDNPNKLMKSKVGLQIIDRLNELAKKGRLIRDPEWKPDPGSGIEDANTASAISGKIEDPTVFRPFAYNGAIALHNQAVLQTDAAIQQSGRNPEVISAARAGLYAVGAAKSKAEARRAISQAAKSVKSPEDRAFIIHMLSPFESLKTHEGQADISTQPTADQTAKAG